MISSLAFLVSSSALVVVACGTSAGDEAPLPPGVYWQSEACTEIPLSEEFWDHVKWCVPAVEITRDGSMEVRVVWSLGEHSDRLLEWGPDDGNRNMNLRDDSGRRYDHYATRRGAAFGGRLYNGDPRLDGIFVFPLPPGPETTLAFRDDDNDQKIRGLRFDPARRTSSELSRSVLGDLNEAEQVEIVTGWGGLGVPHQETLNVSRSANGFAGTLVRRSGTDSSFSLRDDPDETTQVTAPFTVMETFFETLMRAPLLVEEYKPTFTHTDDYPFHSILIRTGVTTVTFHTRSQGKWNVPWAATVGERTYVVPTELVPRALEDLLRIIDPERIAGSAILPDHVFRAAPGVDLEPETELRLAVQRGDLESLERLLDEGADPDTRFLWDDETPLTVAAMNRRPEAMELLLARGANIDATTPRINALSVAAWWNDLETARILLEAGADQSVNRRGWTALDQAAAMGLDKMVSLLTEGVGGHPPGPQGMALYYAAQDGRTGMVRKLLESGANPDIHSGDYIATPLQVAAYNGHTEAVRALLDGGADVESEAKNGGTALGSAVGGNFADIVELLIDNGADVNRPYAEGTYLMRARSPGVVRLLVEAGADVNAREDKGRTVLMRVASSTGGTGYSGSIHRENPPWDRVGAVAQLLEYDVDLDATDTQGRRAIDLAVRGGFPEVVNLLRRAAARQPRP